MLVATNVPNLPFRTLKQDQCDMQLRHIDFRLTVTAQIVELNPFHVCTTHSQCSVIFSTELLFCKKQFFFPVDSDGPTVYVFSLVQDKEHARSL